MKNILVIGAGRFGRYTTIKLHDMGHQTMVVDKDEERINKILPYASNAQIGDSTDPAFMASIGVTDYDLCIVAIGDDFLASLETTFLLDELGAKKIIARATTASQEKFLRSRADAIITDQVVQAEKVISELEARTDFERIMDVMEELLE